MTNYSKIYFFLNFVTLFNFLCLFPQNGTRYVRTGSFADALVYKVECYICNSSEFLTDDLKLALIEIEDSCVLKMDLGLSIIRIIEIALFNVQDDAVKKSKNNLMAGAATLNDILITFYDLYKWEHFYSLIKKNDFSYTHSSLAQAIRSIGNRVNWSEEKVLLQLDLVVEKLKNYIIKNKKNALDQLIAIASKNSRQSN